MDEFNYFALMYLNDWYWWDKPFSERICGGGRKDSREAFHEAAKYYRVTRNFSDLGDKEERLDAARSMLLRLKGPITEDNVCTKVNGLAAQFQAEYGKNAVSAASKFLWLRFKSPVVIFDSRAMKWLRKNGYRVPYRGGYTSYRDQWLQAFSDHEVKLKEACSGLLKVKSYSLAADVSDEKVLVLSSQRWFMERVFDKYLWFNADVG